MFKIQTLSILVIPRQYCITIGLMTSADDLLASILCQHVTSTSVWRHLMSRATEICGPNIQGSFSQMDDFRFYVLLNSISAISVRWSNENEKLCTMDPRLWLKRSLPQAGLEPTTARSVGQRLTHWATGTPSIGRNLFDKEYFFILKLILNAVWVWE